MARAQNDLVDKAYDLFKQGAPLIEIAQQLQVPEGTVRSWKNRNKWDCNVASDPALHGATKLRSVAKLNNVDAVNLKLLDQSDLTDKQKLFCLYYVKCFSAAKAYRKAYECSEYTARSNGYTLMDNARIIAEIDRLKQERYNRARLTGEDIFQKFLDIAFSDLGEFVVFGREEVQVMSMFGPLTTKNEETGVQTPVTKTVNTVRFKESVDVDGTLITEIKQGKDGASIKLADRMRALEWLADHLDLATEEQKRKYKLDCDKLEIEKRKADQIAGTDDGEEHGIIVLPEVSCAEINDDDAAE